MRHMDGAWLTMIRVGESYPIRHMGGARLSLTFVGRGALSIGYMGRTQVTMTRGEGAYRA